VEFDGVYYFGVGMVLVCVWIFEEGDVGVGVFVFVGVEEVVDGWIVLVDCFFDG